MASRVGIYASESSELRPLGSYVLRVRGRPATLLYEVIDLRSGARHLFRRSESVLAFLRRSGLQEDGVEAVPTHDQEN
jgi:hypothetical protein